MLFSTSVISYSYLGVLACLFVCLFVWNRVTKDFWLFYGINTELFQCGSELKSKVPVSLPWRFTAKVNVKQKKFEIDFPVLKEEIEVASLRSFLKWVETRNSKLNLRDGFSIFFRGKIKMIGFVFNASMSRLSNVFVLHPAHSSNVYAVNRNVEDPAKMTPFIPVALQPGSEVTTVMEAEDEQVQPPPLPPPSGPFCLRLFQWFVLHPDRCWKQTLGIPATNTALAATFTGSVCVQFQSYGGSITMRNTLCTMSWDSHTWRSKLCQVRKPGLSRKRFRVFLFFFYEPKFVNMV